MAVNTIENWCFLRSIAVETVGPWAVPDTTQRYDVGTIARIYDPMYGMQELIYLGPVAAQTTYSVGTCVIFDSGYVPAAAPDGANQGRRVAFAKHYMMTGTYGWYVITGKTPVLTASNVAVDGDLFLTATHGVLDDTQVNGQMVLSLRVLQASTATVTFTGHTIINQPIVRVSPLYGRKPLGVFPEMSIVDTADGVQHFIGAAGTTDVDATNSTAFIVLNGVAGTESDRGEIYLGVTAVNLFTTPAVGTVITAHYHNTANSKFWELCYVNRPYLQGRTA